MNGIKLFTWLGLASLAGIFALTLTQNQGSEQSDMQYASVNLPVLPPSAPEAADPFAVDSIEDDSSEVDLPYPLDDRPEESDFYFFQNGNTFDLNDPSSVQQQIQYDPVTGQMIITEQVGGYNTHTPQYYEFDQFLDLEADKSIVEYWQERSEGQSIIGGSGIIPPAYVGNELFDRIFGGNRVDIRPSGNIDLTLGGNWQRIDNPILNEDQRRQGGFDFDMAINMSVIGKIGEKLKLTTNYNTAATFDFENQVKLEYTGFEDDIIKKIEAGNVSLPLPSTLIPGTQSLFGFKTELQFGRLTWTGIFSQQRSETQSIAIQGGAQKREFELTANDYDANRHFLMGHYFRDHYETWLSTLPLINTPVQITRVEVWVTNTTGATVNTRDVVAFADLGETDSTYWQQSRGGSINVTDPGGLPNNYGNDLYSKLNSASGARGLNTVISTLTDQAGQFRMEAVRDFEKTRARKLATTEYTLNNDLGYVSINTLLQPDDILGIAYEYTYQGEKYQVGEFTDNLPPDVDTSNVIFLKMLKSTSARTDLPLWDLMMKNIYSLGAFQVSSEDFKLDVLYQDPGGGFKRYIPAESANVNGTPIIKLLELDNLNNNNDPQPNGVFDFISGVTILPQTGRIIFPVLEPFGDHMREQFRQTDGNIAPEADRYVYDELYNETKTIALQFPEFNRFLIQGSYKSSVSSEIYLGTFNLPRGSVTVTAGGQQLSENVDYTVDYNLGRVKILNESILNSGVPINVNFENNNLFGFQTKTMLGSRWDYKISDDFIIGATLLKLWERPFTQKVNFGDDPINNRMLGFDVNYSTEAPWLTRAIDKIPGINTKEKSTITFTGEVANFKPGHHKSIGKNDEGTIFIDDFEGSRSSYDLKFPSISWSLASTPSGVRGRSDELLFPEAENFDDLSYGKNRARIAWYNIDPLFLRDNSATPAHITNADQSSNFVREVDEREIFPQREFENLLTTLTTFDLAYYPTERGPYNFDAEPNTVSDGVNADGTLKNPSSRWGGIMRSIETNDFEASNIEFVEFWVMDPYVDAPGNPVPADDGDLYINLGNISEDVLKDSRMFFENGLPRDGTEDNLDSTSWGYVPRTQPIVDAFDNDVTTRENQDKGFDGLNNAQEELWFTSYLDTELPAAGVDPTVISDLRLDPAADDYHYYRGSDYDSDEVGILERYKKFNNPQGNSPPSENSPEPYPTSSTNLPESEDLNRDFTLNENEAFFSYRIPIEPGMDETHPYIVSVQDTLAIVPDQPNGIPVRWLQFKIPIDEFDQQVGNISDFRSIRFVRMFLTGFSEPLVMRFARLELVRNQWRRYQFSLLNPGEYLPDDSQDETEFNVSSVSVEENSDRAPIPYVLPPGAIRESTVGGPGTAAFLQNEQALSLEVCPLNDGDARAIFKTLNLDLRRYRRMQMNIHGEELVGASAAFKPQDGDLTVFIRLGSDFTENYYELEVPLKITDLPLPSGLNTDLSVRNAVWSTFIDFPLDSFVTVKKNRNAQQISPFVTYEERGGGVEDFWKVTVIGNPDLGYVESVMIGLRNPKEEVGEGQAYCAEAWVNEFRLSEIDETGGWAALARMDARLADFGSLTLAGNMHTVGFGTLEQQIQDRYLDNFYQYDVALTLELGKFFPKKWGVKLPMYAGINRATSTPQYDPYAFDIELNDQFSQIETFFGKDSADVYKSVTQTVTSIKSLNFTNVRIQPDKKRSVKLPWNIENFDFTYAWSKTSFTDPVIQSDDIIKHRGALNWSYNLTGLSWQPFEKKIPRSKKWLALIRDFNVSPLPNTYSFRNDFIRQFGETVVRDIYGDGLIIPTYDKYFNWDRFYTLGWDLTKSIKLDFSATNNARIDEPNGLLDSQVKKDTLWNNFWDFGRNINYRHTMGVNYNVPLKKIPALDWMTLRMSYNADYNWISGAIGIFDTLGHVITNGQSRSVNGELNFRNLYNKSKFLKKYNSSSGGFGGFGDRGGFGKDSADDDWGDEESKDEDGDKKKENKVGNGVADVFIRMLLMVKRVTLNFSEDFGTTLPGYMPTTDYIGLTPGGGNPAPGWSFIAGGQPDKDWLESAASNGWITPYSSLNQLFIQTYSRNLDAKATLEPVRDLRVDLNLNQTRSSTLNEFFKNTNSLDDPLFEHVNEQSFGSYSVSFYTMNTLFSDKLDDNNISSFFQQFEANREVISDRLGETNPFSEGQFVNPNDTSGLDLENYAFGYGPYSQDVLVPAFLSAYTNKDAEGYNLSIFDVLPRPNWRVTYNGLTKIKALAEVFKSFSLSHGYTSTLTMNSFNTNLNFDGNFYLYGHTLDTLTGNYYALYTVPNLVISESLSPLIGIDVTLKNDLSARFDYKKTRTLSMSFVDYQLSENRSTEFTLGLGYRITGFQLPLRFRGQPLRLENDLTLRFDMSWRDDLIINYRLDQNLSEPTGGIKSLTYSVTADYTVNNRLNLQLFFDRSSTEPKISTSFPVKNTNAGLKVRFTLTE